MFAQRLALAIAVTGLAPVLIRIALLPLMPVPAAVRDEFCYIFAPKTFLLRRMANPTPKMWVHFEPFHILSEPTYSWIFPVGQGLRSLSANLFSGIFGGVW